MLLFEFTSIDVSIEESSFLDFLGRCQCCILSLMVYTASNYIPYNFQICRPSYDVPYSVKYLVNMERGKFWEHVKIIWPEYLEYSFAILTRTSHVTTDLVMNSEYYANMKFGLIGRGTQLNGFLNLRPRR